MARRKTGVNRAEYNRQHRLAQAMGAAVQVDLVRGIKSFRNDVDPEELLRAYQSGDYRAVTRRVPWDKLRGKLDPAVDKLSEAAEKSAKVTFKTLPELVQRRARYDMRNPKVKGYIETRTGELITTVKEGTLEAVRQATKRALTHGLSPRQVANELKGAIGLNARQAVALGNFRNRLTEQEVKPGRIEAMAKSYEARLLDQRAMMIARTEVRFATNAAQQDVWEHADAEGLLPPNTGRIWVVDGAPCPELCLPMDGVQVGLHEPWVLPDGRRVDSPTQSHPHCFCVVSLGL